MALSTELIKSFVEVTKDQTDVKNETTVHGTVVTQNDKNYVQLDGSDLLTPVNSTTVLQNGERVMVLIKDHKATVTGNISSPAARNDDLQEVGSKVEEIKAEIGEFDQVLADKVSTKELEAEIARIDNLTTDNVYIKNQLTADKADIQELKTNNIEITGKLDAVEADIGILNTTKLDVAIADITFATIKDLEATKITVNNLEANYGDFKKLTADELTTHKAEIDDLIATTIKAGALEAYKGTIENLTSTKAEIDELKSKYIEALKLEVDNAKIAQLEAAIAKIETLEASMAKVETLVSSTVITDELEANKATIDQLDSQLANIGTAIIDIAKIENLEAANAEIENLNTQHLNAVEANVENLTAKSATIEQLKTYVLQSEYGEFKKLSVEELTAAKAYISELESQYVNINTILSGSIGTGLLQAIHLTADNVVIDEAVIKDLIAAHIDVSDLHAGKISTDKFTIESDDGGILISGSTQQFTDKNGNVRLQIGKDAKGDFNFIIFGEDGTTAIYNEKGITENAVPDGLIVDDMVSDKANIQTSKIEYVDDDGKGTTLQTHLKTEQGRINALIKSTTIENGDGTTTTLKDKYLDIDATVDGIKTTIGNVQFAEGESIASKLVEIDATTDGIKTTVSQQGTDIKAAQSSIQQNANKIGLVVKSGTSESNLVLTDTAMQLVANNINLKGLVTFNGLSNSAKKQLSNGGGTQLLMGTNNTKELSDVGKWAEGKWQVGTYSNGAVITPVEVNNCPNPNVHRGWHIDASNATTTNGGAVCQVDVPVTKGSKYTLSCWIEVTQTPVTAKLFWGGYTSTGSANVQTFNTTGWYRVFYTFDVTDARNNGELTKVQFGVAKGNVATICGMKMEWGDKATDWSMYYGEVASQELIDTWTDSAIVSGVTTINGGYIKTQTIKVDQLAVEDIFATGNAVMNIINAQEINANRITSGTIDAKRLSVYGLEVKHKETEQVTFSISEQGDVNIRGDIESFDYVAGKRGWSIRNDGSPEFNTVTIRGDVIGNDAGIIAGDGSGENLLLNSSLFKDKTYWTVGASYSIVNEAPNSNFKSFKFSRTGLTTDSVNYVAQGKNRVSAKAGDVFTAQAKFYTDDLSAIDGGKVKIGVWFYDSSGATTGTTVKEVEFKNGEWIYEEVTSDPALANTTYAAFVVSAFRNGEFYVMRPKFERGDTSTPYSLAPEDRIKQVRFWAGSSYGQRENAPFIVYNDGSIYSDSPDNKFAGVFSGSIEIGNISIKDPSRDSGNDALLTIQNGDNGIKRVELTDTSISKFRQDVSIYTNTGTEKIKLCQDGSITIDKLDFGAEKLKINGYSISREKGGVSNEIVFNDNELLIISPLITIQGDYEYNDSAVDVTGPVHVYGSMIVEKELYFSDNIKVTQTSKGLDFNFIK